MHDLVKRLLILLCACCFLVACGTNPTSTKAIAPFTFTNQNDNAFGTNQLKRNIWIATFIFTNCDTICDPMTAEMAVLQEEMQKKGLPVQFVSFSVDPKTDTPETLRNYIQDFTEDTSNWNLLTGYTQDDIEIFAREQFNTMVQKPATSTQVIHGSNFYLVGADGDLLGEYNFVDPTYVDEIIKDVELARKSMR